MYIAIKYKADAVSDYPDHIEILYNSEYKDVVYKQVEQYSGTIGFEYRVVNDNFIYYNDNGEVLDFRIEIKRWLYENE